MSVAVTAPRAYLRGPPPVVPAKAGTQEVFARPHLLDSRLRGNDESAVVPAKAGTQEVFACRHLLDSRLRGNDGRAR